MEICWNIEVWAVQKRVHLVDLVKSFRTNSYLRIWRRYSQERASLSLEKMNELFNALLGNHRDDAARSSERQGRG